MTTLTERLGMSGSGYHTRSKNSIEIGAWTITTSQRINEDRNYYSKSWHRQHGAKYTISDRKIEFSRKHGRGTLRKVASVKSWSGDYIAKAANKLGLGCKISKYPMRYRLDKAYDVKKADQKRGYKFYQRTLFNVAVDWIIESPAGVTYHAATRGELISGIHKKIRQANKAGTNRVTYESCLELGFCAEGIELFCSITGLDITASHSVSAIRAAYTGDNKRALAHLAPEIKQLIGEN